MTTDEEFDAAVKNMRLRYPSLSRLADIIEIDWWPENMLAADADGIMIDDVWSGDKLVKFESDLSKLFADNEKKG